MTISEDKYDKAESFTPVKTFIKNHKNEKETDICKISEYQSDIYKTTTNFIFKYDDQFYTIKLTHHLDEERNINTKNFDLHLNDENGNENGNVGDIYIKNGKTLFIEEVSLLGNNADKNNILNKINDFFDLKLNVDFGNYYKQISTNNKKYELEKQINEDNENQHHFTIDTTVKNENYEVIFHFHQDVNSSNGNTSKLDFNKNEFTKEIYDSIMLSSELYDLMPDVIKYSLKYEDLEIDKDDLER